MKRLIFLVLCAVCTVYVAWPHATTFTAVSCENKVGALDVQAKVDLASAGDTVAVPAGTCTWTTRVELPNTKGIRLQGAGIGSTVIHVGSGLTQGGIHIQTDNGDYNDISGFTLDLDQGANVIGILIEGGSATPSGGVFRIHHNAVIDARYLGIVTSPSSGNNIYGLIDYNDLTCTVNDSNCQEIRMWGPSTDSAGFAQAVTTGSEQMLVAENNIFSNPSREDGPMESYTGGRFAMRFNLGHVVFPGSHGADSSDGRGAPWIELYRNVFDMVGCISGISCNFGLGHFRGATMVGFDNAYAAEYGTGFNLDLYRADEAGDGPFTYLGGRCNGSNPVDGNEDATGWPCRDQIGAMFDGTLTGANHIHYPFYFFHNTKGGTLFRAEVGNHAGADTRIIENRDFYNQAGTVGSACSSAFNGTCGVGRGTATQFAAFTTCTGPTADNVGGVAFWVTDEGTWNHETATDHTRHDPSSLSHTLGEQGRLYKCTSTNHWALFYTPAVFPHSLNTDSGGATGGAKPLIRMRRVSSPQILGGPYVARTAN